MPRTVIMKFGGAALATAAHFRSVANCILEKLEHVDQIVVVVSAMGKMTDELMGLAREVSKSPIKREEDMLISVGERISTALLAMALAEKGVDAISLTGSQSGIITCQRHLEARILTVKPSRLLKHLKEGRVVIVAGFQGVSEEKEITTLGRGGSDTSAVALGVALCAECVEFYKDVRGFHQKDPKKEPDAELYPHLSYEEALTLAETGSSPLHPRCILLASKNGLPLHVVCFKEEERKAFSGTVIAGNRLAQGSEVYYEDDSLRESSDSAARSNSSDRSHSVCSSV